MLTRVRGVLARGLQPAGIVSTRSAAAACTCRSIAAAAAIPSSAATSTEKEVSAPAKRVVCAACSGQAGSRAFSTAATPFILSTLRSLHLSSPVPRSALTFRTPSLPHVRSFSTATKPPTEDGGADFVKRDGQKLDGEKEDAKKEEEGGAGGAGTSDAHTGEPRTASAFYRHRWKFFTMGTLAAGYWAFTSGWITRAYYEVLESSFLSSLRKNGAAAIPEPGSWGYAIMMPTMIGMSLPFREVLHKEPETLDKLLEGLKIEGLEKGALGVSSEQLSLKDMCKANWILSLLTAGATASVQDVKALRLAHQRSVDEQNKFIAQWDKDPEVRAHAFEQWLATDKKMSEEERTKLKAEFRTLTLAQQQARYPTLKRSVRPRTLADVLVQHGLHHKAKETTLQLEEEEARKFWREKNEQYEREVEAALTEEKKAELRSAKYTSDLKENQEKELKAKLESERPFYQRIISEAIEKQLSIQAWTLLKCLAEPSIQGKGLLLGREHAVDTERIAEEVVRRNEFVEDLRKNAAFYQRKLKQLEAKQEPTIKITMEDGSVREMDAERLNQQIHAAEHQILSEEQDINDLKITANIRRDLLNQYLIPMCIAVVPSPTPGGNRWGVETQASATELLGSLLFDIPDLGQTWKNQNSDLIKNALFSALANLAQVYVEGQYPGGAVRAAELVVQCDPQNVQLLTTLAVEKLKLGLAQQLLSESTSGQSATDKQGGMRTNPYLSAALGHLSSALKLDPTNLEASFQMLKILVATGERDEKVLQAAVDRLIKAVRHSPTTIQPQNIGLLPGQSHEGPSPLEETIPQLSPAYNLAIRTLEKLGRTEEAQELASEWSFRVHADALSHFTLGRLQLREGDLASAEASLQTAFDLDPSKPEILYQRALAKYKAGAYEEAEDYVLQALEARAKVEKRVRQRVHQQLAADLAQRAADQAQEDQAQAAMAALSGEQPTLPSTPTNLSPPRYAIANTIPSIHLLRAKLAVKQKKEGWKKEALEALEEFEKEKPLATEGLILKANLLQQDQRLTEAYATFAQLARVWRERINAPVASVKKASAATSTVAKKASGKKDDAASSVEVIYRPATTRKAYFDDRRRSSERAIFEKLSATCTKPTDKAAQAAFDNNMREIPAFRNLCEEIQKLKNLK